MHPLTQTRILWYIVLHYEGIYQITSSRWIYTPLLVYEVYSMRLSLTSSSPLKYPPKRGLFSLPCIEIFTSFLKYIKMWSDEWRCLIPSPVKVVELVRDFDAISFHWYWMGLMWHIQPLTLWSLWWLRDEIISRFCIIISIIWITSNLTFSPPPLSTGSWASFAMRESCKHATSALMTPGERSLGHESLLSQLDFSSPFNPLFWSLEINHGINGRLDSMKARSEVQYETLWH